MTKILALIPARGGSKSIPQKNIKQLGKHPLIGHTIQVAKSCKSIDRVLVSTDSIEIANVAKKYKAETPFLRPHNLAEDNTPDRPVFIHALNWLKENENYMPDIVVHLRCTTPFKTIDDIEKVLAKLNDITIDSARTVSEIGKFHPYWVFRTDENGLAHPFIENIDMNIYYQRQMLPPAYSVNGLVDAMRTNIILNHTSFWGDRVATVLTPTQRAVDIDSISDFEYAEFLLQKYDKEHWT